MESSHATVIKTNQPDVAEIAIYTEGEVQDVWYEKLGIDDVRKCIDAAQRRPSEQAVLSLVIRTGFITHESQNALLKLLEEPPLSTRILLLIPPDLVLLPTVLSRVQVIQLAEDTAGTVFEEFLTFNYTDRLAAIDKATKAKDSAWQQSFKQGLIAFLASGEVAQAELEYVARTLLTRGASNKMLLEQAALSLPIHN